MRPLNTARMKLCPARGFYGAAEAGDGWHRLGSEGVLQMAAQFDQVITQLA